MQNRMALVLCNLKPAKWRGVLSQAAAVLCARSPDRVEILDPPRAEPGDRVTVTRTELTPRQKVWEQIQAYLFTDGQCVATYRGAAFGIAGKGASVKSNKLPELLQKSSAQIPADRHHTTCCEVCEEQNAMTSS
ncbi:hypothetical protein F7725_009339 [Dissostichus mawsoni]|uniref:Uncharacterized protein n=1 Tax=Dissostichus mawsoni TaxID=36200 RepID=A0A7J5Z7A9_DISMA|nr:hypothetical protein F7725_009339 [Dissostichus mawsoni]